MKIAVFYHLPPGGAKRIIYEQVKGFSKNHQVDVYTLNTFPDKYLNINKFAHQVFIYKFKIGSKLPSVLARLEMDYQNFIQLYFLHKKIAADIDSRKYDLVYVTTDVYTETPFILRFLKTPSVYYCMELLRIAYEKELDISSQLPLFNKIYENITRKIRKGIDKTNAQNASIIIAPSKFTQSNIKKAYGKKAVLCYPGVDSASFYPLGVKKENKILFVGNKDIIDAYDLVKKAVDQINISIRPIINVLSFSWTGPKIQNHKKLIDEYSSSLALVCTDHSESFGLKVLESMACETPVLGVNEGGYKETIEDGKSGYLFNRSVTELSQKILYLIKHPQKAKLMGKYAREYVMENWSWGKSVEKLESIFNKVSNDNKDRILISGQDSGGMGGSEKFLIDLANELKVKNNDVEFTTVNNSKFSRLLTESGYHPLTVPIRMDILGWWKGLIKFIIYLPAVLVHNYILLSKYKKGRETKIIIPGFSDKIILSPLAKLLGYRVIWVEYAPLKPVFDRNFGIPRLFYRYSLQFADKIICPTKNTYQSLLSEKIFDRKKLELIPVGIKIVDINIKKVKKEKIIIGMVSRIEEGKGQDTLIEAARILQGKIPNLEVQIIGEGDDKFLINLISKYKLQKIVKLMGYEKDIHKVMSKFDVQVFPTRWPLEGFGLVCLEAMMLKIPLVASNFGPVPEVIGDSGVLVNPKPTDLARGIMKVINNPKLAESLVRKGSIRVKKYFDIVKIASAYNSI